MNRTISRGGFPLTFGALSAAILGVEWWLVHSFAFQRDPYLFSIAITFDLVAVIPALFYFLILRPRNASPLYVVPCFILCMIVAGLVVPRQHQQYLTSLHGVIAVLEVALLVYVFSRIPPLLRAYRELRLKSIYFTDAVLGSLRTAVSSRGIVSVITAEFFLMYFAFAGWFLQWKGDAPDRKIFSYHRKSGYGAILAVLMMVLVMETFAVHMIVSHWSRAWAWGLTALSIYGVLWLLGDYHAVRLHPIVVRDGMLFLRTGMRWRADIPVASIEDVRIGKPDNPRSKSYLRASVLGPRAVICLRDSVPVEGLFGIRRSPSRIGVSVDDPEGFRKAILDAGGRESS